MLTFTAERSGVRTADLKLRPVMRKVARDDVDGADPAMLHPGYIRWEEFERNQATCAHNVAALVASGARDACRARARRCCRDVLSAALWGADAGSVSAGDTTHRSLLSVCTEEVRTARRQGMPVDPRHATSMRRSAHCYVADGRTGGARGGARRTG